MILNNKNLSKTNQFTIFNIKSPDAANIEVPLNIVATCQT